MTKAEAERSHQAFQAVARFSRFSPLKDLDLARREVDVAYERLLDAIELGGGFADSATNGMNRNFSAWLAAFRSFVDRIKHDLADRHGKDSDTYQRGLVLFSDEFDANVAYRFSDALRNVSEHRTQTLNAISTGSRLESDGSVHFATVGIDVARHAAEDVRKRMRAGTRREMEATAHIISAGTLIRYTNMACNRITARIMWLERLELAQAVNEIKSWHDEVVQAGGETAFFATDDAYAAPTRNEALTLRMNPIDMALEVEANLLRCGSIDSELPPRVSTDDLALNTN